MPEGIASTAAPKPAPPGPPPPAPHRGTLALTVVLLALWIGSTLGAASLVPPVRAVVDRIGIWLKLDVVPAPATDEDR